MAVTWEIRGSILIISLIESAWGGIRSAIVEAMASAEFQPGTSLLFDVTRATDNPGADEFRAFFDWLGARVQQGIAPRVAVVVGEEAYQYGLARMGGTHLEFHGIHQEIFTDLSEACGWLSQQRGNV